MYRAKSHKIIDSKDFYEIIYEDPSGMICQTEFSTWLPIAQYFSKYMVMGPGRYRVRILMDLERWRRGGCKQREGFGHLEAFLDHTDE